MRKTVLVTKQAQIAKSHLKDGGVVATLFGKDHVFGFFGTYGLPSIERIASIKKRDKKPFFKVTVSSDQAISNLFSVTTDFHPGIQDAILEKAANLLKKSSVYGPLGILLPANAKKSHILTHGTWSCPVHGEYSTTGFMVTPEDESSFSSLIDTEDTDLQYLAGTSANLSGHVASNGSGHHDIGGLLHDFSHNDNLCLYVPAGVADGKGTSTTVLRINLDGGVDLVRLGSISVRDTIHLLESAGIFKLNADDAKEALPFDYTHHESSHITRRSIKAYLSAQLEKETFYMHPNAHAHPFFTNI